MAKKGNDNLFVTVGSTMFRPGTLCFSKYFENKGAYGMGFEGNTKVFIKESDRVEGIALQKQVHDGVMGCGDGVARINLPDYGFIAVDVIDQIEMWDGKLVIKNNLNGKVVQRFSPDEYKCLEDVSAELDKAVATAGRHKPHRIDWPSLMISEDSADSPDEEAEEQASDKQSASSVNQSNKSSDKKEPSTPLKMKAAS